MKSKFIHAKSSQKGVHNREIRRFLFYLAEIFFMKTIMSNILKRAQKGQFKYVLDLKHVTKICVLLLYKNL